MDSSSKGYAIAPPTPTGTKSATHSAQNHYSPARGSIKNVVIISPVFPPNLYLFCTALSRIPNVRVLTISDSPYDELRKELRDSITRYYKVDSLENYEQVMKAVAFFIHEYGRIHRLESFNEHWLENDAQLRLDFNITGLRPEDMQFIKLKSMMKEKFREAGLRVAEGERIESREEGLRFCSEYGFPIVAKPDNGVGAQATYKLNDYDDFNLVDFSRGYFFEEFIEGRIVTFDGLVDRNRRIVYCTSHEYSQGVMEIQHEDNHVSYHSIREMPQDLQEAGEAIIEAFDLRERFFHFEFFRRFKDDKLVCLEVNMRPPGGYSVDMMNYANDMDLYRIWAEMIVNDGVLDTYPEISRPYHVTFISRKDHIAYKHTDDEVKNHPEFARNIVFSDRMPVGLSLMGHNFFMFRSSDITLIKKFHNFVWEKP